MLFNQRNTNNYYSTILYVCPTLALRCATNTNYQPMVTTVCQLTYLLNPLCAVWLVRRDGKGFPFGSVCRNVRAVFMVSPLALRSLSIVRLHVSFGRPLFFLTCGVHRRAILGIEWVDKRRTWPSHCHLRVFMTSTIVTDPSSISQVLIGYSVRPEDLEYSAKAFVLEYF